MDESQKRNESQGRAKKLRHTRYEDKQVQKKLQKQKRFPPKIVGLGAPLILKILKRET